MTRRPQAQRRRPLSSALPPPAAKATAAAGVVAPEVEDAVLSTFEVAPCLCSLYQSMRRPERVQNLLLCEITK